MLKKVIWVYSNLRPHIGTMNVYQKDSFSEPVKIISEKVHSTCLKVYEHIISCIHFPLQFFNKNIASV